MSQKTFILLGMTVGSLAGGYVPVLFGVDAFSFTSILLGGAGGVLGIWIAYKLAM